MPHFLAPMLPTLIKEPFDSLDWIFEPKLDSYRAVAVIDPAGKTRIWSRNHLPPEQKFPTVGQKADPALMIPIHFHWRWIHLL